MSLMFAAHEGMRCVDAGDYRLKQDVQGGAGDCFVRLARQHWTKRFPGKDMDV